MKILHTSDWHIGKRLGDRERLPEQIEALDGLADLAAERGAELIVVAGDVFDTYLPSAEAEEAFFRAVKKLAGGERAVVIVSGNHDDGVRLSASAPLAEEQGVYIIGNRPAVFQTGGDRPVRLIACGPRRLLFENRKGEKVYINALPYPNEARLKECKTEESYAEKTARWIAEGEAGYTEGFHLFLSHLFVAGGKTSESERDIDLGGARAVPLRVLPAKGYCALGHLHKPQKLGENVYYSGSLLPYSFDEANEKFVNLITTEGEGYSVEHIPVPVPKKLVRLSAKGLDEALALLPRYCGSYIDLTLYLDAPLTSAETESLRAAADGGIVNLSVKVNAAKSEIVVRSNLKPAELFAEFFRSKYGSEPSEELSAAFLELLSEEV